MSLVWVIVGVVVGLLGYWITLLLWFWFDENERALYYKMIRRRGEKW